MLLTPTEYERLTIYTAAELARRRRGRGRLLNHPEAIAIIVDEILEGARDGRSVADMIGFGSSILSTDDVMPGVAELMPIIQVEGTFPDGTKLVTVHDPIRPGKKKIASEDARIPGEIMPAEGEIELNGGRAKARISAINRGDRPIQVGSHYHFFETNRELDFDRAAAFGRHLDIPAGTAVRFEPGETKEIVLVTFGGSGEIHGLNNLTNGTSRSDETKAAALQRARDRGFRGA